MRAEAHRTRHGRPTARFVRPDGRTPARHADAPRAEFAPLRETPHHAILSTFFGKADGKSKTRTANPQKQFAPCAIGLPFAGIFDPVTQGVFHT